VAQYDPMGSADDPRVQGFTERWKLSEEAVSRLVPTLTAATDGRCKLIIRDGVETLYDLERDPDEQSPIERDRGDGDEAIATLRSAAVAAAANGAGEVPPAGSQAPGPEELAALERQMKLLGYL
jgi:hypothetical protein